MEDALHGQDAVIHLAAETGTGQSMYEVERYVNVNVRGTAILIDLLANSEHHIQKVVLASSRSIYGEGKYFCSTHHEVYPLERAEHNLSSGDFNPKCPVCDQTVELKATDEQSKIHPSSIYGITKQNQEQMILVGCKSLTSLLWLLGIKMFMVQDNLYLIHTQVFCLFFLLGF